LEQFLTNSNEKKIDWFNVTEASSGKLRLTGLWKPVLIDDIPNPSGYGKNEKYCFMNYNQLDY
jgi:hypothetical protein